MLIHRSVLYVFILLQCFAPLLHAHMGGPQYGGFQQGGFHLPASIVAQPLDTCSFESAGVTEAQATTQTITLTNALQARDALLPTSTQRACLPWPAIAVQAANWSSIPSFRPTISTGQHLIPLPGAPPNS